MEEKQKYIDDLKEIRDIMNRSSKFISLSGLSGVSAGIVGTIGAVIAYRGFYQNWVADKYQNVELTSGQMISLITLAIGILVIALASGLFFTARKARKNRQKLNDPKTQRLLVSLALPLVAGGLICLLLLVRGQVELVAPLTLVFYGLGLVNAGNFTLSEIRSLGIVEVVLGVIACYFSIYGIFFWAVGFGFLHIVYGIFMHRKYGS